MGLLWVRITFAVPYVFYLHHEVNGNILIVCTLNSAIQCLAGQDYQAVTNMPLGPFGDRNRRQCFNVTILDDARPENSEDFTVNVHPCAGQPPPGRVIINPRIGRTTIEDEDRKLAT